MPILLPFSPLIGNQHYVLLFPEELWSQMCFTILRATMRDQPHFSCDFYHLKPTVLSTPCTCANRLLQMESNISEKA